MDYKSEDYRSESTLERNPQVMIHLHVYVILHFSTFNLDMIERNPFFPSDSDL